MSSEATSKDARKNKEKKKKINHLVLTSPKMLLTLKAETRDIGIARARYAGIQNTKGWKKQSSLESGKRMGQTLPSYTCDILTSSIDQSWDYKK